MTKIDLILCILLVLLVLFLDLLELLVDTVKDFSFLFLEEFVGHIHGCIQFLYLVSLALDSVSVVLSKIKVHRCHI